MRYVFRFFLVFCLALLPSTAWAKANSAGLTNGEYLMDVMLEGGTGRASIASPTTVVVADRCATATIEWSSPHYDYMIVGGDQYLPTNDTGNSTFEIPVPAFDEPFEVIGDTTAMSTPHEITYLLTFDSASAQEAKGKASAFMLALPALVAVAALLIVRLVKTHT